MLTRKEIAALDAVDCSPWTVKRWLKKFGIEPDQRGHGPDKYKHTTATRFVKLFNDLNRLRGSTPQITRAKYAGDLFDARQLTLFTVIPTTDFKIPQYTDADGSLSKTKPDESSPEKRIFARAMEKTDPGTETRGGKKTGQAEAAHQARCRRPAAAQ